MVSYIDIRYVMTNGNKILTQLISTKDAGSLTEQIKSQYQNNMTMFYHWNDDN